MKEPIHVHTVRHEDPEQRENLIRVDVWPLSEAHAEELGAHLHRLAQGWLIEKGLADRSVDMTAKGPMQ
jgi:hypothetical protein